MATELAALERIVLICGRYEGVDERVIDFLADREISIGDYVLSGGELGAAVIVEAVTRLLPGALGNEASSRQESFTAHAQAEDKQARIQPAARVDCWIIRTTRVPQISRDGSTGSAGQRQSPGDPALAARTGFEKNVAQPPRSAGCAWN